MSDVRDPETDQQLPVRNDSAAVQDLVIADIEQRKALGLKKYGTLLQAHNGRDMLRDAYDEALDLCIYLRGALEERAPVDSECQAATGVAGSTGTAATVTSTPATPSDEGTPETSGGAS